MKYISYLLYNYFNIIPKAKYALYCHQKIKSKKLTYQVKEAKRNFNSYISIIAYNNRGYAHYSNSSDVLNKMIPWIESKGYKVTRSSYNTSEITISL